MTKAAAPSHAPGALLDEPVVLSDDDVDKLDEEALRALDEAIDRSDAQIARGETVPFEVVLGDVRRRTLREA